MTKNTKSVKDRVCCFDSLYPAMIACARKVRWKESTIKYLMNGVKNCAALEEKLQNGTYEILPYSRFTIYEPKKREIVSTRYTDRVFQRALCTNYLYAEITRGFIYDNGACLNGKGTDFARNRLQCFMERYYRAYKTDRGYILKFDVKSFFGSIDKATAKREMRRYIRDKWAYGEVCRMIDSYGDGRGLGLGSQLSQLIATALLNRLDHILKEKCRCKFYTRYMDDGIIIANDKETLKRCLSEIKREFERLGLTLNVKKTEIIPLSRGFAFLGFRWRLSHTGRVLKSVLRLKAARERRRIKRQAQILPAERVAENFKAWAAHAGKATCGEYVIAKMKNYLRRIVRNVQNCYGQGTACAVCA